MPDAGESCVYLVYGYEFFLEESMFEGEMQEELSD